MGFVEGDVVEVLLTTISENEKPNAAPMGVWIHQGGSLTIRPYDDTQTARNLEDNGNAVMNLSQDPNLFLRLAFKEELSHPEQVIFESATTVKAPRIKDVAGFVEVLAKPKSGAEFDVQFKEFECCIQHVEITSGFPVVYSRARSAAIECVIHATKIRAVHQTNPTVTKRLTHQIGELHDLVERIAPDSPSAEVIHQIEKLLPRWIK